jgi:hypothetical protein
MNGTSLLSVVYYYILKIATFVRRLVEGVINLKVTDSVQFNYITVFFRYIRKAFIS